MLEGGAEHHAWIIAEDVLGAVAVVNVEVDDGNPRETVRLQGMRGSNGDVVENAEAHGLIAGGVMARRTAGDKGTGDVAAHHQINRHHRTTSGMVGGLQGMRVHAGVGVEGMPAFGGRGRFDKIDIGGVMHPQQLAAMRARGFVMRQEIEQVGGVQPVVDCTQPRGAFRMPDPHVVQEVAGVGDVGGMHGEAEEEKNNYSWRDGAVTGNALG